MTTERQISLDALDLVFGKGEGATPEARARVSVQQFVKSLDLITFDKSERAAGRRLTAIEALDAYGFEKLLEIATDGSAVLCDSVTAVGRVLKERRGDLGLNIRDLAVAADLSEVVVKALESSKRRPVREYERAARILGLDERMLSFRPEPEGNQEIAIRMRTLHAEKPALTGNVVAALAEASWVAMTQLRLEKQLGIAVPALALKTSDFYGSGSVPAYRVGYDLAKEFRRAFNYGDHPIKSMREVVEKLGIPVIHAELGSRIAGATISIGSERAVVLNLSGRNRNVFVLRSTLAHEVGHIVFDPPQVLRALRVDEYDELDRRLDLVSDPVEQRANAFAVELLAPGSVVRDYYQRASDDCEKLIQSYGISFTAARYHTWNAMNRNFPVDDLFAKDVNPAPEWEAQESYTATWHPIQSLMGHPARAGKFSAVVLRAAESRAISWDTAAEWLLTTEGDLRRNETLDAMRSLYSDVFNNTRTSEATGEHRPLQ